jgi:hypothetical protein
MNPSRQHETGRCLKAVIPARQRSRLQRRDKRVRRLGGYPGPAGGALAPERFVPELGEAERERAIVAAVDRLGAESFDEATGDPLDNQINAQADNWEYRLHQQLLSFGPAAQEGLERATGIVEQYHGLHEQDVARLDTAEVALETAILGLSGIDPAGARGPGRRPRTVAATVLASVPAPAGEASPGNGTRPLGMERVLNAPPAGGPGLPALPPPRVSRIELRRLLAPQDASRVPQWGEPGFRDGALLAGRPRGSFLYTIVLIIAAGADLGAFVQVVERVITQSDWVEWLVVSGMTAAVLALAHVTGVQLREARAERDPVLRRRELQDRRDAGQRGPGRPRPRFGAWICLLVWLGVGALAFWVRYSVAPVPQAAPVGGTIGVGAGGAGLSAAPPEHTLQAAAIFLGLYLATGVVAAVGAYLTHNPYRGRFQAAMRAYRRAAEQAAASAFQLRLALARQQRQEHELQVADEALRRALTRNRAVAEQLKQTVRVHIAGLIKDPAVTDAIFGPDRSPYRPAAGQHPSPPPTS